MDEVQPTEEGGGGETGHPAHGPVAERHDGGRAVDTRFSERMVNRFDRSQVPGGGLG